MIRKITIGASLLSIILSGIVLADIYEFNKSANTKSIANKAFTNFSTYGSTLVRVDCYNSAYANKPCYIKPEGTGNIVQLTSGTGVFKINKGTTYLRFGKYSTVDTPININVAY